MTTELPVHFFTIVLNGEPFIEYHLDVFRALPFRWQWHIVEGVAELKHDTAWSVEAGGRIADDFHTHGRSNDGTSAYLDRLAREFPDQVTVYRKPPGVFWDGKREMVSAPLPGIRERCLLWQVDADELWTVEQIVTMREAFIDQPQRSAAFFWCHYFVGPTALISTRETYANHSAWEWLRVWRYRPGDWWRAHEPPRLARRKWYWFRSDDVGRISPIMHAETEQMGLVFQHFAYVTEAQLRFKEIYYGYAGAVNSWRALQDALASKGGPLMLRDYLPWVTDEAQVETAARLDVTPIAVHDSVTNSWRFNRGQAGR
jgi:hypothetical protein